MPPLRHLLRVFGIDPGRLIHSLVDIPSYLSDRRRFRKQMGGDFFWGREIPILDERKQSSGSLGAYFHQDLLVAKWIREDSPDRHVDVGSRIDGFIGHLAVFREVEVLDIRPQTEEIPRVTFHQLDLMQTLPGEWTECSDSVSCLHTIEHFGLGRYGDAIDPGGHLKGLEQLKRMVKSGGRLYLSTPMGSQRVEFNAHRIFSAATIIGWFSDGWEIERFAYLNDAGKVIENADCRSDSTRENFGCSTGLAILSAVKW